MPPERINDAAHYRVIERCFIQPARTASPRECSVGEEIEFDDKPGLALLPLDDEARAAKLAAIKPTWSLSTPCGQTGIFRLARSLGAVGEFPTRSAAVDFVGDWIEQHTPH